MINFKLLNSILDERASQGIERRAHDACRGLHLAGGTLWGFVATLRGSQVALAPFGCPVRLVAFGAWEPEGGYRVGLVPCSRQLFANGRDRLPVIDGQPSAARFASRSVLNMAVPFDNIESSSVLIAAFAAEKTNYNDAKRSMDYFLCNYFVVKQVPEAMKVEPHYKEHAWLEYLLSPLTLPDWQT